ncbi:MAG: hypothetical protein NVS2B12_33380 [Ktedonobacteraceae bacterium]
MTTDEPIDRNVMRSYARTWVFFGIGESALLALTGANVLFSLVYQVDWSVCNP